MRSWPENSAAAIPSPRADAWRVLRADPVTAFGTEGRYDRARLARLFVGRQVEVARGALESGGDVSSYTLITPVPDRTLSTLDHDTMVIVTHVGRLTAAAGVEPSDDLHPARKPFVVVVEMRDG